MPNLDGLDRAGAKAGQMLEQLDHLTLQCEVQTLRLGPRFSFRPEHDVFGDPRRRIENRLPIGYLKVFYPAKLDLPHGLDQLTTLGRERCFGHCRRHRSSLGFRALR